jgi:hypothetical protein
VRAGGAVALTAGGRKAFFRAYEMRMDTLVTHPLFEYRVSYRRLLEIQARLLARVLEGGDCGVPGVYDAVVGCERRVGADGAGSARGWVKVRDGGS